jgi:hypothetical protein
MRTRVCCNHVFNARYLKACWPPLRYTAMLMTFTMTLVTDNPGPGSYELRGQICHESLRVEDGNYLPTVRDHFFCSLLFSLSLSLSPVSSGSFDRHILTHILTHPSQEQRFRVRQDPIPGPGSDSSLLRRNLYFILTFSFYFRAYATAEQSHLVKKTFNTTLGYTLE